MIYNITKKKKDKKKRKKKKLFEINYNGFNLLLDPKLDILLYVH